MKRLINNYQHYQLKETGFTLIELLISMTIALIVSTGAVVLFANTVLSTRTLNNASAINEAGNRLNMIFARHFRMAGYVDWMSNADTYNATFDANNANSYNMRQIGLPSMFQLAFDAAAPANVPMPLSGCNGAYNSTTVFTNSTCATATTLGLSSFTVAYQVASNAQVSYPSSVRPTAGVTGTNNGFKGSTGMLGDCNNNEVTGAFVANRFFLRANTNAGVKTGEPIIYDLLCQGNATNTPSQPLANNIEQFVIMYGVPSAIAAGTKSNDLQVNRYLTAAEVTTANVWNQVLTVRTCVLITGERNSATAAQASANLNSDRLDCLGSPMRVGEERRLRQAFTQTINIRNQMHSAT